MTCTNCSFQNKEGVAFCGHCGERLALQKAAQPAAATTFAAAAQAVGVQTQRARPFCGNCGSELRPDGACLRCSGPRSLRSAPTVATPVYTTQIPTSTSIDMPQIPTRKVMLALGAIGAVAVVFFAGKAMWGDEILVRTNVPGATILVDGEEKGHMSADGATPVTIKHLHGKIHTFVVKADGYIDATTDVTFPNQMVRPLTLNLTPKPSGLRLYGLSGSLVFLNDRFAGRIGGDGSWSAPNLRADNYRVAVRQQGYVEWTHNMTLKPGDQQSLSAIQPEVPLTPEQKMAKARDLLNSANQKFMAGQYPAALADCEASQQQGAGDEAATLCERIRATMTIVNGGAK